MATLSVQLPSYVEADRIELGVMLDSAPLFSVNDISGGTPAYEFEGNETPYTRYTANARGVTNVQSCPVTPVE